MRRSWAVAPPSANSCCLAADEIAVHRVGHVDAHPAVHVHRGVRHPVTGLGRPELGRGHRQHRSRPAAPGASSQAACHMVSRTASTSTKASASRCVTAWNEPIGRPNATRLFAYSAVSSSARSITPDCTAHSPTVARATSQSATSAPAHRRRAPGRRPGRSPSSTTRPAAAKSVSRCGSTAHPGVRRRDQEHQHPVRRGARHQEQVRLAARRPPRSSPRTAPTARPPVRPGPTAPAGRPRPPRPARR